MDAKDWEEDPVDHTDVDVDDGFMDEQDADLSEEEEELKDEEASASRRKLVRIVSLFVAIAFLGLVLGNTIWYLRLPPLDFLRESLRLSQNSQVKDMQKAVVVIESPGRMGTGFNIASEGLIITNAHVVDNTSAVDVKFSDTTTFTVNKWSSSPDIDLAVIKLQGTKLPSLQVETEHTAVIGDAVTVIGNPLGFPRTVTEGKVVDISRVQDIDCPVMMIQGTIHHGSSGSPVINKAGKVVGVIFATLGSDDNKKDSPIIGLAIPIDELKKISK